MESWVWTTLLLCAYGFVKEIRPSEPYETEYLESSWKNLTLEEINDEVYPVWTYSYLAVLFLVLFITDFLRYKPVIIAEGLAYIVTWSLMLWAQGVLAMQFMEFSYGIVSATEVAFFTYIYAKVPQENYKKVTGYVRSSALFGQFLSGTLSQILVSTDTLDFHQLNYVSFSFVCFACVIAVILPSVPTSIYFHRRKSKEEIGITHENNTRPFSTEIPDGCLGNGIPITENKICDVDSVSDEERIEQSAHFDYDSETTHRTIVDDGIGRNLESQEKYDCNTAMSESRQNCDKSSDFGENLTNKTIEELEQFKNAGTISEEECQSDTLAQKIDDEEMQEVQQLEKGQEKTLYVRIPFRQVARVIWHDLKSAYTDPFQVKWCVWWALATCSYEQVLNYCQPLWEVIYPSQEHNDIYNGSVYALNTLLGGLVTFAVGYLPVNWDKWGEPTLAITSLIQAALLFIMAETTIIWLAYTFFILFSSSYCMLIAIASFQVAKNLKEESFGLVFGCNTFLALLIQTILTGIVVNWLKTGPRTQFLIYGGYVTVIGIIFMIITFVTYAKNRGNVDA